MLALISLVFSVFLLLPGSPLATSTSSLGTTDLSAQTIRYLPLGDSYTAGVGLPDAENYPHQLINRLEENSGQRLQLVGEPAVGGYTTQDLIDHELSDVSAHQPDLISIEIGTNDLEHNVPTETFQQHLNYILDTIQWQDPNAHILLMTIPDFSLTPRATTFGTPSELHAKVKIINEVIEQTAQHYSLPVVDIYSVSQAVAHDPSLLYADNYHPSAKGYATWVDAITQKLIASRLLDYPNLNKAQY